LFVSFSSSKKAENDGKDQGEQVNERKLTIMVTSSGGGGGGGGGGGAYF
jgi:uncharacterized membrane protein